MTDKASLEDLAVFGGAAAFAEKLYVGRPNVGDRARLFERMNDMLDRRWLTNNGRYVQELEARLAEMMGVKHCIAMCNATIGLEIAVRALGLRGEVIVPSFTFVATAHALQWQEITPIFCDVDPATHNVDPASVEQMITPRTSGIIGVHLWGRACPVEELAAIARRHDLRLIYDAAHAFACSRGGRMIGGFGDAEVFSFHATKFFNSFEGGAVTTNDDELAAKMRLMKNFGFAGYDRVIYIGTNGKMSEVAAAMGLTSLESLDEFIAVNRANYLRYREGLEDLPGVRSVTYDEADRNNYQYVVLEIDESRAGISRDEVMQILWAENVVARRYFYPGCHRMEPYRSYYPHAGLVLPVTEQLVGQTLLLPNGTAVGEREIDEICAVIRLAVTHGAEAAERLRRAGRQTVGAPV
ncbi:MAG TPA: aminotransferase class I/II-fold pyridoxal phosphate-dependent enzyme [Pyrinomonadaceae bacterium]|jgi:dTDP-4-amino-4,6-dideoxygalactose transaminase|nr:aminotransferase class I/II-fold pyridoxal phosphate-dependent enzyme [Pyrinomonadaceae bacterium]